MWLAALLLLAFADPFWLDKPATEWTDIQLAQFFVDSPWTGNAMVQGKAPAGAPIPVFILSAEPVAKAAVERNRRNALRSKRQEPDALEEEGQAWFDDNKANHVILAVRVGNPVAFSQESEVRRLEEGCWMHSGRDRVKMSSYFPPSAGDPYLRLAFPRSAVNTGAKTIGFEMYLPGVPGPNRQVEFMMKDLMVDGKPQL